MARFGPGWPHVMRCEATCWRRCGMNERDVVTMKRKLQTGEKWDPTLVGTTSTSSHLSFHEQTNPGTKPKEYWDDVEVVPTSVSSRWFLTWVCICILGLWFCLSAHGEALYQNNFEQSEIGKAPDDFLILEGGF